VIHSGQPRGSRNMTKTQSILLTLIVYKVVLTLLGIRSRDHGLFLAMLAGFR